jgi:hypothetical protein
MFPSTGEGRLPPLSVVTVPLGVETLSKGIGQPACSMPSGKSPSLLTGYTPPDTARGAAA